MRILEVIVAVDQNMGIGNSKKQLPWNVPEELKIFKDKSMGKTVIVGRKTAETLPVLPGRYVVCLTRNKESFSDRKNVQQYISSISGYLLSKDTVLIAGGGQIYQEVFEKYSENIKKIHISIMNDTYQCDVFFNRKWLNNFVIVEETKYEKFTHYVMEPTSRGERQYLESLENIQKNGIWRKGRNGETVSIFKNDFAFDLRNGFPLLTTKKMFLRGIIEELLFFLRGDTDSKKLSEKGVRIWEGNTDRKFLDSLGMTNRREGVMGPCYGYQWRFFNAPYDEENASPAEKGIDQLANVINLINNDPYSRRIFLTAYNPEQLSQCVLPPCHSIVLQFYVQDSYLDMAAYSRSSDMFLGIPFNIASYALFLMIIAKITDKIPRMLHITMGDAHIYKEHVNAVKTQLERLPYKFPSLRFPDIRSLEEMENLCAKDFVLSEYRSYPTIKAGMVA